MSASNSSMTNEVDCADFLQFEDTLKKMRVIDDKIIYELNCQIPTESFAKNVDVAATCESLYKRLTKAHKDRNNAIRQCITRTQHVVNELKDKKQAHPDDVNVLKRLRAEQSKLRLMQSELNVEEVVSERSNKAIYERCRGVLKFSQVPST